MYLNTDNFVKELPYKLYCTQNKKRQLVDVNSKTYLSLNLFNFDETDAEIIRIFELLSNDYTYIIKESMAAIFMERKDIVSIYTKLDTSQTFSQVRVNKYFKSFIGPRQLIYCE